MRPESDAAREEFRRAEIAARIWLGRPIGPRDYEWAEERLGAEALRRSRISLGTEAVTRRDLLDH